MENDSIAIFDSGFGGLTVMRAIIDLLPYENLLYLGDTANLPYGNKSKEAILRYSSLACAFLMQQPIKLLVIACNSACSAGVVEHLQEISPHPVIGVVSPLIQHIGKRVSFQEEVTILGTRATIASGMYEKALKEALPQLKLQSIACPLFVPMIEEGYTQHPLAELAIQEYLPQRNIPHTLLLGCTHYPLLKPTFQKVLGKETRFLDPALFCAEAVRDYLKKEELLRREKTRPHYQFYVSDDPEKFQQLGKAFLQHPMESIDLLYQNDLFNTAPMKRQLQKFEENVSLGPSLQNGQV